MTIEPNFEPQPTYQFPVDGQRKRYPQSTRPRKITRVKPPNQSPQIFNGGPQHH